MKEKTNSRHIRRMLGYAGVLAVWSVISAALILMTNASTSIFTLPFYVLIVVISLSNLSPLVLWIALFASSATIISINLNLWGMSETSLMNSGLAISVNLIGLILCHLLMRAYRASRQVAEQNSRIIEENVVYDQESGLMRWKFVSQTMRKEIARSRRLGLPLSVILLDVPHQKLFPNQNNFHPQSMVSELFLNNIQKDIDVPFIGEEFGVILPEKDLAAADKIAWQMVEDISNVLGIDITVGIASMNSDDDTQAAIIERAKSALSFGLEISHAVVSEEHLNNKNLIDTRIAQLGDMTLTDVGSSVNEQDLKNLGVGINDWVVWVGGIREAESINWTKERFQFSNDVKFLMFHEPYMAVKINTQCADAAEFAEAFAGWEVKEIDPARRLALICPGLS